VGGVCTLHKSRKSLKIAQTPIRPLHPLFGAIVTSNHDFDWILALTPIFKTKKINYEKNKMHLPNLTAFERKADCAKLS